jgi:putative FmdB family regulatory protein
MPMYDWRCNACNHVTETMAKYTERDQPVDCEECGSKDVDRQMCAPKGQKFRHSNKARREAKTANIGEL